MQDALETLDERLRAHAHDARVRRHSRAYRCRCKAALSFADLECGACGTRLGYLPDQGRLAPLEPGAPVAMLIRYAALFWRNETRKSVPSDCTEFMCQRSRGSVQSDSFAVGCTFGLISVGLNTSVDVAVALLASRARHGLSRRPGLIRRTREASGVVMCGLGAALALARRPV